MSELVNIRDNLTAIHWKLLTSVSALTLTAYISSAGMAHAEDASRPQIWIELGANLNQPSNGNQLFAPPFFSQIPTGFPPPTAIEKRLRMGLDWESAISFQPDNSDWSVSVSARYGRKSRTNDQHFKTKVLPTQFVTASGHYVEPLGFPHRYEQTNVLNAGTHAIIDFMAGKDVGLGMFGLPGTAVFNGGVRFAEFTSRSAIAVGLDPDSSDVPPTPRYHYHKFNGAFDASRSFHGIGPSISLKASSPVIRDGSDSEFTFDWGANGAVLFGRQKVRGNHSTIGAYYCQNNFYGAATGCPAPTANAKPFAPYEGIRQISQYQHTHSINRSRMVIVPNIGAFAGISYRLANAKLSLGYRADFFFGAMDGGIDTTKKETVDFYGPFASISVGIGG
jgi:hypothetical protein